MGRRVVTLSANNLTIDLTPLDVVLLRYLVGGSYCDLVGHCWGPTSAWDLFEDENSWDCLLAGHIMNIIWSWEDYGGSADDLRQDLAPLLDPSNPLDCRPALYKPDGSKADPPYRYSVDGKP